MKFAKVFAVLLVSASLVFAGGVENRIAVFSPGEKVVGDTDQKYPLPQISISGVDAPIPLGELVSLSLSPINAQPPLVSSSVIWKVFDYNPKGGLIEKQVVENPGGIVYFGAGIKDKKMLVTALVTHLYVAKDGDKITQVATKSQYLSAELTIGAKPANPDKPKPPAPTPVVLPDGKFKMAQFVYDEAMKVAASDRAKGANAAATAYKGVVELARKNYIVAPDVFLAKLKTAVDGEFDKNGVNRQAWDAFATKLQDNLWNLYKTNKLNTMGDYADAIDEVILGLQKVK